MELSTIKSRRAYKPNGGYFHKQQKHKIKSFSNMKRWCDLHKLTIAFFILLQLLIKHTTTIEAVPAKYKNTVNDVQILQRTLRDVAAKSVNFNSSSDMGHNNETILSTATIITIKNNIDIGLGMSETEAESVGSATTMQNPSTELTFVQPQGQCLLDGEYVPEATVFCTKQVGCRAIQKTGHCCPDYKCDCEKDGKTYVNGDKLVDPDTPCTVCYCQGGEILCSSVTCFHRDDCKPKYIPGVCCPEYDNCPVLMTSEMPVNTTLSALITTTTMKPSSFNNSFHQKITIKEITKPIEIRITDDNKAIPIPQVILKQPSATIVTTTNEKQTAATTSGPSLPTQKTSTLPSVSTVSTFRTNSNNNGRINEVLNNSTSIKLTSLSVDTNQYNKANAYAEMLTRNDNNSITNSTNSSSSGGTNSNEVDVNSSESLKLTPSISYATMTEKATAFPMINEHEEINRVSNEDVELASPSESSLSVLNNLLSSHDPNKVNIKREYFINTQNTIKDDISKNNKDRIPNKDDDGTVEKTQNHINETNKTHKEYSYTDSTVNLEFDSELDSDSASSHSVYHIVLTTDPATRLTYPIENSSLGFNSNFSDEDYYNATALFNVNPQNVTSSSEADLNRSTAKSTIKQLQQTQQHQRHHQNHQMDDDDGSLIVIEPNPAYPSLPEDDFSLRDVNFQINESDDLLDEAQISSSALPSSSQDSNDSDRVTKIITALDDNEHYYDGGSGLTMDELITTSSTARTITTAKTITTKGFETTDNSFINKTNRELLRSTSSTIAAIETTTKTLAQFINSSEDTLSEETIISNIDITNLDQLNIKNDTIKDTSLENGSGESQSEDNKDEKPEQSSVTTFL